MNATYDPANLVITNESHVEAAFGEAEEAWVKDQERQFWSNNDPDGENFECSDNFRFALVGCAASEAEYEDRANGGCCGSVEEVFGPSPLGNTYRFGFNYGH